MAARIVSVRTSVRASTMKHVCLRDNSFVHINMLYLIYIDIDLDNKPALVQIMAWYLTDDKPLISWTYDGVRKQNVHRMNVHNSAWMRYRMSLKICTLFCCYLFLLRVRVWITTHPYIPWALFSYIQVFDPAKRNTWYRNDKTPYQHNYMYRPMHSVIFH